MKKISIHTVKMHITGILPVICLFVPTCVNTYGSPEKSQPVKVEQRSSEYIFTSAEVVAGTLTRQMPQSDFLKPDDVKKGFAVKFSVDLKPFSIDETILKIPQILTVRLRQHDRQNRDQQNYPAFSMPDGSVPILEASVRLKLYPDKDEIMDLTAGIPLAMLDAPFDRHEIVLNFTGVCWTMYIDSKLVDNDFALGYPVWSDRNVWEINPNYVHKAEVYYPALQAQRSGQIETVSEIQYWTPSGHNSWVGDVATIYHEGRYHVFYLYDRRHHASKFGRGGHYFEHLSTADFKTWIEHEAATPIEEQWETFGTGTPFVWNEKLCVSYGLHTTRIYPKEQTNLPLQWDFIEKNGFTGTFHSYMAQQGIPAGATYSVSDDGVSLFRKTGIVFHPCENPSVYIDPEGKLKLLANYQSRGTWESDCVDGGWRCINKDFPLGGDCTFFFRWGKFDYIIGGFVNQWIKPAGASDSLYTDLARQGFDFYDGIGVPSVTEIPGGRYIMAGWMPVRGWGGPLVIRELIQFPDGRIGAKWMDEIIPKTAKTTLLDSIIADKQQFISESESFLLAFQVVPIKAGGKFGVVFSDTDNDKNASELQIRTGEKRAQFSAGSFGDYAAPVKSLREGGSNGLYPSPEAIENLSGIDKPFTVRVMVRGSGKLGGSLIDAEIAEERTLITYRPDLYVKQLLFRMDGVEIRNIKISKCFEL
ncbi:MAG: hypothetical protein LBG96_15920 [Tannerella sp.]|jgi:hypothetical protein|nr:hypothetical protein [Tannerella sp.]